MQQDSILSSRATEADPKNDLSSNRQLNTHYDSFHKLSKQLGFGPKISMKNLRKQILKTDEKIEIHGVISRVNIKETKNEYTENFKKKNTQMISKQLDDLKFTVFKKVEPSSAKVFDFRNLSNEEIIVKVREIVHNGYSMPDFALINSLEDTPELQNLIELFKQEIRKQNEIL